MMQKKEQLHPLTNTIKAILQKNQCWFKTFFHQPVKTSEEANKVRKEYSLKQGAKALILQLKKNGQKDYIMLVLPGDQKFNSKKVKKILNIKNISFATEEAIQKITNGVLPGGIPPFGNLFNLKVFADEKIFDNEKIIFNAGDRRFSIAMKSNDYFKIVKPIKVNLI